jgi:hypothetical protein
VYFVPRVSEMTNGERLSAMILMIAMSYGASLIYILLANASCAAVAS